jgi:anti-sigma regulatory factor (Ser/Thr protein kinase)
MTRTTQTRVSEPAQATTVELRQALAGHGIRLPSLGVDAVTYARGWADPLVSLGNCPLDEARKLAAVLRRLDPSAGDGARTPDRTPLVVQTVVEPRLVGPLRARVATQLTAWGLPELAETARLCVSELLTNVVRHVGEGTAVTLRLWLVDGHPRLELTDPDPHAVPELRHPSDEAESGRGLALLDALTTRWGVTRNLDSKTTWCDLGV